MCSLTTYNCVFFYKRLKSQGQFFRQRDDRPGYLEVDKKQSEVVRKAFDVFLEKGNAFKIR